MDARLVDYSMASDMLREAIDGCKILEAVKTTQFKDEIDIMVPLSASFEEEIDAFGQMMKEGKQVWNYVCCVPSGDHLNRFLDINLIKSRLLFWAMSLYNVTGYLHWGLNQQPKYDFDPFENSNTPNEAFDGIFPSGDAFMVYPDKEEPLSSLRLEAQRRGAEDFERIRIEVLSYLESNNSM